MSACRNGFFLSHPADRGLSSLGQGRILPPVLYFFCVFGRNAEKFCFKEVRKRGWRIRRVWLVSSTTKHVVERAKCRYQILFLYYVSDGILSVT